MERLTKAQIIEDTVRYYEEDPSRRALRKSPVQYPVWQYLTEDGRRCAVGRYMIPGCTAEGLNASAADTLDAYTEEKVLRPEALGHSIRFWSSLQSYHDSPVLWRSVVARRKYVSDIWTEHCADMPMPQFTFHPDPEPETSNA